MSDSQDAIPLFEIDWSDRDISNVTDSISRGSYWAKGPYVDEFESKLESYLDVEHAITVNSGTTALVAALHALGIDSNDEVILPSFTFIATANAVRLVGADPVFTDIEPETYGLDPGEVEANITENTAAILPVHCYGSGCQITELQAIAEEYGLHLVEDAAEVLGAEYDDQKLGTFGTCGVLSFCQNKIIATGEGGAVVTDDDELAERIRLYRSHGRVSSDYFQSADSGQYTSLGTNIRMSDMTAALGCSQLERIDSLIEGRRDVAKRLNDGLKNIESVRPHQPPANGTHVYQLYTIELAGEIDRSEVIETLADHNIASKIYWDPPVHRTEYYNRTLESIPDLAITDDIASRVLSLPMHPNLSSDETDRIIEVVKEVIS